MPEDFSKMSDSDVISGMTEFREHRDIYAAYRAEWERRKRIREDQMLSMTEALVDETDKLVILSRRALWIAIIACIVSTLAIASELLKWLGIAPSQSSR